MSLEGIESFRCENCKWQGKVETHTAHICPRCGYSGRCPECDHETFDDERVADGIKCGTCTDILRVRAEGRGCRK